MKYKFYIKYKFLLVSFVEVKYAKGEKLYAYDLIFIIVITFPPRNISGLPAIVLQL